jgi:hypothetical protein
VARARLSRAVAGLGLRLAKGTPAGHSQHTIVNRRLEIRVYRAEALPVATALTARTRWMTDTAFRGAAIPTLARKIARAGGFG